MGDGEADVLVVGLALEERVAVVVVVNTREVEDNPAMVKV